MLYYRDDHITIYHGDCREIAPTLSDFDALISDPPYGIGYCHGARKGGAIMGTDCQAIEGDDQPFDPAPWLLYPVVILWGGNHFASRLPDSPCWLVWDKRDGIPSNDQADCEMAWTNLRGVARLKTRYWNGAQAKEKDEKRVHSNQKPLDLMKWCISLAGTPKSIIDPFMGSGSTLRAAKDMGLTAVGIEIDERHCESAAKRMAQEVLF